MAFNFEICNGLKTEGVTFKVSYIRVMFGSQNIEIYE